MNSRIMFIPGITIADVILMQQKINNINIENKERIANPKADTIQHIIEKVPKKFTGLSSDWPLTTMLKCSMCTLSIKGAPFPIAILFEKENSVDVFTILPNVTCGAMCCALYVRKYLKNDSAYKYILKKLASIFYGFNALYELPEAIAHTNLQMYGGDMTAQEFIDANKKIMKDYMNLINIK